MNGCLHSGYAEEFNKVSSGIQEVKGPGIYGLDLWPSSELD